MRKVAALGWWGHDNFGDTIILEGLKKLFKGWEIVAMSNDNKGSYPIIDYDVVNKCDLFVLGGGELIMPNQLFSQMPNLFTFKHRNLSWLYRCTPLEKLPWIRHIRIPKIILGCGVNAASASELSWRCVDGLKQFDYIGVRDIVSKSILQSIPKLKDKVHLSYDLAFSAVDSIPSVPQKENFAVVVPTERLHLGDRGLKETCSAIQSMSWLEEKLLGFDRVVFLAFGEQDNNDYVTCKLLSSNISNSEIIDYDNLSLPKVLGLMSEASLVLPYRLHGLILSFITGTSYEFYPYHWKLQRVRDTIKGCSVESIQREQRKCVVAALEEAKVG
jgi:polysaccharide pyruvyl transferase WcaK-like protein